MKVAEGGVTRMAKALPDMDMEFTAPYFGG
jgi:hypothetical protein